MFSQISIGLLAAPIDVHHGDITGDGVAEILVSVAEPKQNMPEGRRIDVYGLSGGEYKLLRQVSLSNKPMIWDIEHGWWGLDSRGLIDIWNNEVISESHTWLRDLGPTTPISADIATDLNDDGIAEIIWPEPTQWRIISSDGHDWGAIPEAASGQLRHLGQRGGYQHKIVHESSILKVADIDGQGAKDIMLVGRRKAKVVPVQGTGLTTPYRLRLPIDTDPVDRDDLPGGKDLSNIWFRDINGDQRVDMAWQYWVTEDSWFGATAELGAAFGKDNSFGSVRTMKTEQAVVDVRWTDWDGNGIEECMLLGVDLGMATLARALISKSVHLTLSVQPIGPEGFGEGRVIWNQYVSIENPDDSDYDLGHDWTGDKRPDLLLLEEGRLSLYINDGKKISDDPIAEIAVGKARKLELVKTGKGPMALTWSPSQKQIVLSWFGDSPF